MKKKKEGLSRLYHPPKEKPQYGANWDNLADSETGRVQMPRVDYPLQNRDVALGVRFAKEDIQNQDSVNRHLKAFKTDDEKISYLNKILRKEKLLSPDTRKSVYKTLGGLYVKEGNFYDKGNNFEGGAGMTEVHTRARDLYRKASESFEKAGEEYAAKEFRRLSEKHDIRLSRHRDRFFGLEHRAEMVITIAGVLGGIFFLSSNITGNAIADLTTKTTSFLGAGLLIVGLVAGFFWVKSRKK